MKRKVARSRIALRASEQEKYLLELAALLGGYASLSNFMLSASEMLAKDIFANMPIRKLSPQDSKDLKNLLQNSPEPNSLIKAAHDRVMKTYKIENNISVYEIDESYFKTSKD